MPAKVSLPAEPLLYLIGVNHAVQFKAAVAQILGESESVHKKREAFKAHVVEMIDKLDIEILAEEFSDEAKRFSDEAERKSAERETALDEQSDQAMWETALAQCNRETVLQQLGRTNGIEHRFCDPDASERKALGIDVDPRKETDADRRRREQVWLSRIADCKRKRVLFVCGDDHYDAFAQLLVTNGFNVQGGPHYPISDAEFLDL
jgi:hypothetical protein